MKLHVERPPAIVDINPLQLTQIEALADGSVRVGAMVRNTDMAHHDLIRTRYPLLSQAILAGASAQVRNMATTGGNLLQRTRCYYFRDTASACNKREPGSGCGAIGGFNRIHAVLGTSEHCIATHPSDMCVALAALDAIVRVRGRRGERTIPLTDFHVLPGDHPERETVLDAGDLIMAVDIPALPFARRSVYVKVRDRASYAFALASAAVASIDAASASAAPGVIAVLTADNAPRLPQGGRAGVNPPAGRVLSLLQTREVRYNGEPMALVVADSFERATYAASLVRATYRAEPAAVDMATEVLSAQPYTQKILGQFEPSSRRGDPASALQEADVTV